LSVAEHTTALYNIAQLYSGLGWSVIPVHGNKVAAVEWKSFQHRRPTQADVEYWFTQKQYPGLAIVTGAISGIFVLDFDDPRLFHQFHTQYANLAETRTVKTRRGYHLYFRLASGVRLKSRKIPGVDLLSDGRYVVAPPTVIGDHTYKVTRGGQPRILNAQDAKRIQAFLDALTISTPERLVARANSPFDTITRASCESAPEPSPSLLTFPDLTNLYRHLAVKQGRNEALFKVSLRARDSGWDVQQTIAQLAEVHAAQAPHDRHKAETRDQRRKEAERTIRSAFSRPPRQREHLERPEVQQMPNSVREELFSRKQTYVVRVIEALRLKGIHPGDTFSEAEARELLSGLVGKHSIREALTATNPKKVRRVYAVEAPNTETKFSNNALLKRVAKTELSPQGRPTLLYHMPSNAELCAKLDVEPTHTSDPLTTDDLRSAKKTRQAAHREFIRRRPGHYPRVWLANRLGVSVATEQRYNGDIPIQVTPTYTVKSIFWWNLKAIPDDLDVPGLFLQDETGKRYPAQQSIARSLLSKGKNVMLVRQGVNYYSYSDQPRAIPNQHLVQQRLL
jgi:hypothetical protein